MWRFICYVTPGSPRVVVLTEEARACFYFRRNHSRFFIGSRTIQYDIVTVYYASGGV